MVLERFKKVLSSKKPVIEDIENQIEKIMFEIIDEINAQLPEDQRIEKKKGTLLYGEGAALDSMEFLNFLIAFEHKIQSDLDFAITLADEEAMSQEGNPFQSIESLADYAIMLIKENATG